LIDLNCHVLPGEEDGPANDDEAVKLLAAMVADGVDTAAVTPFIPAGAPADMPTRTRDRIRALREAARGEQLPALLPGAEVDLAWALGVSETDLQHASLGGLGKTLLVRVPEGETPPDFDDLLQSLKLRGYMLVLARPERSKAYQSASDRIGRLVASGVLLQLEASSLVSDDDPRARRFAQVLLQEGAAHVIAGSAGGRLSVATDNAQELIGQRAKWMTTAAPAALLAGAPLPDPPPIALGSKRRFGLKR
jgi:protein-tyrosine phosphatase